MRIGHGFEPKIVDQMDVFRKDMLEAGKGYAKDILKDGTPPQRSLWQFVMAAWATAESALGQCLQLQEELKQEREKSTRYCGVFQRALTYRKGDLVTYNGSLWACIAQETVATPGVTEGWQLAVKSERR